MQRRKFGPEFKVEAVRLVRDGGISAGQAHGLVPAFGRCYLMT